MATIISVDNLTKTFTSSTGFFKPKREVVAVDHVSFEIKKGECVAFIGPNGGGKSTTVKMLTSILHPTSGTAEVLLLNPWKDRKKLCYKIGAVFGQKSQLYYHLPSRFAFHLLAAAYDIDDKQAQERIKSLVQLFEIEDLVDRPVRTLSLGQRMRAEIVAALIHRPEILFLDEPTIGLDIEAKNLLRRFLKKINEQEGITIFLTSHDTGDIENITSRILLINKGKLMIDSNINQLKQNSLFHKYIQVDYASGNHEKIMIDNNFNTMNKTLQKLLSSPDVIDLRIENQPLESIISDLFKKTNA